MGIDPFLSSNAPELQRENDDLRNRIERLERMLPAGTNDGAGA